MKNPRRFPDGGSLSTSRSGYFDHSLGVDLSAGMLAKVRERNVYDELHEDELVAFMRTHPTEYDLVISADTLVYFGLLEEAFGAAHEALRPGGHLLVSVVSGSDSGVSCTCPPSAAIVRNSGIPA